MIYEVNISIWKRANFNTKMNIENSFKIYGLDRLIQVTLSCIVNKKLQHIRDIYIKKIYSCQNQH